MRKVILSLLLALSFIASWAQKFNRPDSYNYSRGVEAIQNNNAEEALEYLNKEIEEHPDNGYAYSWIALIRIYQEEYGLALTATNTAIKHIPSKDKAYVSFAYSTRARVNLCLGDTARALKDCGQAIKTLPEDAKAYNQRAQIYYEQKKYDLSDADFAKMVSIDEGDVMGYMGIGRNANAQKRWDDAIKQFDYVIKLSSDYSSGYSFRAESYVGKKQYDKAIDDVLKALSIDGDRKAHYYLRVLADSAYTKTVTKLKIERNKALNDYTWGFYLGVVYESVEKYHDAIEAYKASLAMENNDVLAYRLANCYDELGDYDLALSYCNQAISLDSTDTDYIFYKANIENNTGKAKEAISTMDTYIEKNPESSYGYYQRGWFKDHLGDIDGAIEDYSMSIAINPNYAYVYLHRGVLYRLKNDMASAKDDFEQCIKLDSVLEDMECAQYAYYYIGNKEKAVSLMDDMLKKRDKGNYYDAACLYSIMGETDRAVDYLRKALELGFRRFSHIKRDRDLNNIRNEKAFIDLIQEYEDKHALETKSYAEGETAYEEKIEEIPFTKEGDLHKVKCAINNLPLHLIFDTGASNVSLSSVEATFMVKNGYLSPSDIIGKQHFLTASGEVSEGTIINLKEVKLGNLYLENVKAAVVRNQSAPLLLGQSVLNKLGRIEIDNAKRNLKITYKIKK